jgi:hypothetical protein
MSRESGDNQMLKETTMSRSLERGYMPAISWGAVFAGFLFALSFAALLYLFGAAIGVTTMAAMNEFRTGVAIGTGIWILLSWIVAMYAGGWLAGRLAGRTDPTIGGTHGLVVWALSGLFTWMTLAMPLGGMLTGSARLGGQAAEVGSRAGNVQVPEQIQNAVRERLAEQMHVVAPSVSEQEARRAVQRLDQKDLTDVSAALIAGRPEDAERVLSQRTDLSREEVSQVVAGTAASVRGELGSVAEQAGDVASTALWVLFLISLLGLAAGAWGGIVGARRFERFLETATHDEEHVIERPRRDRGRPDQPTPAPARP